MNGCANNINVYNYKKHNAINLKFVENTNFSASYISF